MAAALAVVALVLAGLTIVLAYYIVRPIDFDGLGRAGVVALLFPLHLLVVTLLAAGLGVTAWALAAGAAATGFGLVAALTLVMAVWPCLVTGRVARREGVPLSIGAYLADALRPNFGAPAPDRTVVYGTAPDGTALELDVWRSDAAAASGQRAPAVVKVHGGSWTGGNRGEQDRWNRWLNDLGYHVFDVDYRLPPLERWSDEVADVKAALAWVVARAAEYGVDPARISVLGMSAGGNLGMLAAYTSGDPWLPPSIEGPAVAVRCVVNVYGPADLASLHRSSGSRAHVQRALGEYLGGRPDEHPDRYRAASPVTHAGRSSPPTITVIGGRDRLVPLDQVRALDEALSSVGAVHESVVLPADDHGFDVNWGGFGTQLARARIERFLARHG